MREFQKCHSEFLAICEIACVKDIWPGRSQGLARANDSTGWDDESAICGPCWSRAVAERSLLRIHAGLAETLFLTVVRPLESMEFTQSSAEDLFIQ